MIRRVRTSLHRLATNAVRYLDQYEHNPAYDTHGMSCSGLAMDQTCLERLPACIMIGAQKKEDPFYKPEVVAQTIAWILHRQDGTQKLRVEILGILSDPADCVSETEQREEILLYLKRMADISRDDISRIHFVLSRKSDLYQDSHTALEVEDFTKFSDLKLLCDTYHEDEAFQTQVEACIPE